MEKQVFSWRDKNVQFCCIITWKSRFSHDVTVNKVQFCCIITFLSRFSQDAPKTRIFDAWLRGKAGLLMTHHNGANLLHYYVEKQVFPWRAKNSYIWCIITWKSRFSHDATENSYIWCIITKRKKKILLEFYVEEQVFSWRTKISYIWCINTWKSMHQKGANLLHYYVSKQVFSWRDPKQSVYLMHYYVS